MMSVRMLLLWAILAATMLPGGAGAANLFLTNAPERSFEVSSDEPVDWIRARPADLDMDAITAWMSGDGLGLNLFDDVVLSAEFLPDADDPEGLLPGGVVWRTTPSGESYEDGTVVLVDEGDGRVHGDIYVHGFVYEILPTDTPPLHIIVERPAERDLGCATEPASPDAFSLPAAGTMATDWAPPIELKDRYIRVLMLQTAESSYADKHVWVAFGVDIWASVRRSIDSKIAAAFKRARMAFHMSGTAVEIGTATSKPLKLGYSEHPFLYGDLVALSQRDLDGHITGLRDAYRADVVFLWRRSSDPSSDPNAACGLAVGQNGGHSHPNMAYAVGSHGCFERVFAHELGHLLGAQHDFFEEGATPYHSFGDSAFGFIGPTGGFLGDLGFGVLTVMAYEQSCRAAGLNRCVPINYFSTPSVTVNGKWIGRPRGTVSSPGADNASVINFVWRLVANYRQ